MKHWILFPASSVRRGLIERAGAATYRRYSR